VASTPVPDELDRPWIRSYPPGVPPAYHVPDVPLHRLLVDAARDFPGRPGLLSDGLQLDHAALLARVEDAATALARAGVLPGARVLLALPPGSSLPVLLLAVWRLGAIAVPVDTAWDAEQLRAISRVTEPAAVLAGRAGLRRLHERSDGDGGAALPEVQVLVTDDRWLGATPVSGAAGRIAQVRDRVTRLRPGGRRRAAHDGALSLVALLAADDAPPPLPPLPSPTTPAVVLTADPADPGRGVVLTHANLVASAFHARLWVPDVQAGAERVLVVDPLHVPSALVGWLLGLLAGATVCVIRDRDADALARTVERVRPSLAVATPATLRGLLREGEAAKRDLTSLRVVLATGAPVPAQLAADLERRSGGARVREVTGWPETSALTHGHPVYGRVTPRTLGVPVTGTVAAVVEPDHLDALVPHGQVGRLLVHGPQVAAGYVDDAAATAARFRDGWFVTDLLVTVDDEGTFRRVGSDAEVAVRDGHHVAPRMVEEVLERHPGVVCAAVVGDPATGAIVAAVTLRRRRRPDVDELQAHCVEHLDAADRPDRILVVESIEETAAGEVDRAAVRRLALDAGYEAGAAAADSEG
jgi:long-chain acyl-CoA synthetase